MKKEFNKTPYTTTLPLKEAYSFFLYFGIQQIKAIDMNDFVKNERSINNDCNVLKNM